jgi:hypothetical protein
MTKSMQVPGVTVETFLSRHPGGQSPALRAEGNDRPCVRTAS